MLQQGSSGIGRSMVRHLLAGPPIRDYFNPVENKWSNAPRRLHGNLERQIRSDQAVPKILYSKELIKLYDSRKDSLLGSIIKGLK